MSSTVVMPTISSDSAFFGPTPANRVTGISARARRRRAISGSLLPSPPAGGDPIERLFDAEQVRVQRLAPVVDLGVDSRIVLPQPFCDVTGLARGRTLALDHGDDLVVVGDQLGQQAGGGVGQRGGHDLDAGAAEAEVVALGDRSGR